MGGVDKDGREGCRQEGEEMETGRGCCRLRRVSDAHVMMMLMYLMLMSC